MLSKGTWLNPPEMHPEQMGNRLRAMREALGLKKSEVADAIEIERTYWSRFEGGQRPLSFEVAARLCSRYGVTMDYLILGRLNTLPLDLAEKIREHL